MTQNELALLVQRTYRTDVDVSTSQRIIEGIAVPYGAPELVSDDGLTSYLEEWQLGVFRSAMEPANRGRVRLNFTHDETSPFTWVGKTVDLVERAEGLFGRWKVDATTFGDVALEKARDGQLPGLSVSAMVRANVMRGEVKVRTDGHLRHVALVEQPAFSGALVTAVRERMTPAGGEPAPAAAVPSGPRAVDQLTAWLREHPRRTS